MAIVNFKKEWNFLKECEKNSHTAIAAKQRFIQLLALLPNISKPRRILDVGGNFATARWFQTKFPKSKITILNNSEKEIASYPFSIKADAQSFRVREKFDLIFCGETIEHTYNPDGLIGSCLLALKPKGYFILTTPNLSCLYNKIFILLGWPPGNYSASLRYKTGNPFLQNTVGKFGYTGDHKSVFTWKELRELLELYGFRILDHRGFSYGQAEIAQTIGWRYNKVPFGKLRLFLNNFLPHSLREGMMFVCQAPFKINTKHALGGILKKDLWKL